MEETKNELLEKIDSATTIEQLDEIEKEVEELVDEKVIEETTQDVVEDVIEEQKEIVEEQQEEQVVEENKCEDDKEEKENISSAEERALIRNAFESEKINFNQMEERKMDNILETKEYRNAFLKGLQGKKLNEEETRALTTATSSVGYGIPTELRNKIEEILKLESPAYADAQKMGVKGYFSVPVEKTINDATWVEEGSISSDSADALDRIDFNAYKLIKTISITAEVEAMEIEDFENWIVKRLADKLAVAIDNAIFNGKGSTYHQPVGILEDENVAKVEDDVDYESLCELMSKVDFKNGAKFYVSGKTLWNGIAQIKDGESRPIFMPSAEDGMAGRIFGYPVVEDDHVGDDIVVFGNMSKYIINMNKDITIDKDNSVDFRYGNAVYRGMALLDGHVVNKNAFGYIAPTASF